MEVKKIRQELNELIKNIVEHSESFPANRPIPSLEVSAVISKVNKMQERLAVLKYLLEVQENQQKATPSQEPTSTQEEELVAPESAVSEIIITEQVAESETPAIETSDTIQQEVQGQPQEKTEEKVTTVAEDAKTNQEIAQKLSRTPIKSLKEAFSLNDRYLYANELFDKNMEAFNNLIKTIDESSNMSEAHEKLITAKTQYNWDEENNLYVEFSILVERRFS
ncbi:MAG: hypothetical protein OQJ96_03305 [Flavobacteriales bacterium]|nr:hypothetical protein [Flavobacteriales bacterium]MCW8912383.1 hypothetical protein [Flavobacteriales bacterium]MCW8936467.1 hypothetical protein [Flavobacteriales bacterium]MCW8941084.1 hypothetical protein [Flavobacteriales bacterium]MCW8967533.1 hypothetical protein [Flavobacteriales bacterium]